jgi:hypothetical protein
MLGDRQCPGRRDMKQFVGLWLAHVTEPHSLRFDIAHDEPVAAGCCRSCRQLNRIGQIDHVGPRTRRKLDPSVVNLVGS